MEIREVKTLNRDDHPTGTRVLVKKKGSTTHYPEELIVIEWSPDGKRVQIKIPSINRVEYWRDDPEEIDVVTVLPVWPNKSNEPKPEPNPLRDALVECAEVICKALVPRLPATVADAQRRAIAERWGHGMLGAWDRRAPAGVEHLVPVSKPGVNPYQYQQTPDGAVWNLEPRTPEPLTQVPFTQGGAEVRLVSMIDGLRDLYVWENGLRGPIDQRPEWAESLYSAIGQLESALTLLRGLGLSGKGKEDSDAS